MLRPVLRRDFLFGLTASVGSVALSTILNDDASANPLAPKRGHFAAKAKSCILLFMVFQGFVQGEELVRGEASRQRGELQFNALQFASVFRSVLAAVQLVSETSRTESVVDVKIDGVGCSEFSFRERG